MKHRILLAVLVAGGMSGLAGPAWAQFYPGFRYGGWGGTNAAALLGSNQRQATIMQIKAQNMQTGQQATMAKNNLMQSGIRDMMSSQAQSRSDSIVSQKQANQDWWFQHQSQQMAQRWARANDSSSAVPAGFAPSPGPPAAALDVIQWPTILQDPGFTAERARIEAPYRRTPPKLSAPTPADYRKMADTVEDMKAMLTWRLRGGINTSDFNAATTFLNQLGAEVAARAQASDGLD